MHNMKTGHTCHICNSTYSDASDLEFHMKRVHGLEKISWSVKDKAGHRSVAQVANKCVVDVLLKCQGQSRLQGTRSSSKGSALYIIC